MTAGTPRDWKITSGALAATVALDADGRVWLTVSRDSRVVLPPSPVGIRTTQGNFEAGLVCVSESRAEIGQSYRMRTGKRTGELLYQHDELRLTLRTQDGAECELAVRVAKDGVAFRHSLPAGADVRADASGYRLPEDSRAWVLEYTTWYEMPRFESALESLPSGDYGYPTLVRVNDDFLLLTESNIDGRYCGSFLRYNGNGEFSIVLADDAVTSDEQGLTTPWRTIITGDLATIVESTLVDELAEPAEPAWENADWIRPGRAAWSWWSDHFSGAYLEVQKSFVDHAATQGWEHLLVDCGWDPTWVPELVAYASQRTVQVHLWTAWDRIDSPEGLAQLALWRSWGVAGIKVDFMESESRDRYQWYDRVLRETARLGLMVNFHGSVIPRGWQRTWPHVMSYEGIRGAEYYSFYQEPLTALHNVIQPFSRNVAGSMDYTPVTFTAHDRETSDAHELALSVVYESGIQHFADHVSAYAARPTAARVLSLVPPVWDETKFLTGYPGRECVLARRAGELWFVAGICSGEARTLCVPMEGSWNVELVQDGLVTTYLALAAGADLKVPVDVNGGFVAILSKPGSQPPQAKRSMRHGPVSLTPAVSSALPGDQITVKAGNTAETSTLDLLVPPGWASPEPHADGREWTVTVPSFLRPGQLGVLTLNAQVPGQPVPVIGHARVVAPLAPGKTAVSTLPFLKAANGLGPVERDMSNGDGDPNDGRPMSIAGQSFATGLGVCAPAEVEFHVGGSAREFTAWAGIDDETGGVGMAVFEVYADGVLVASTGPVCGGEPAVPVTADLSGAQTLRLVVRSDEPVPAHADWAGAYVHAK